VSRGTELILVARRAERLRALAESLPCEASWLAADLTDSDAPERVRAHVAEGFPATDLRERALTRCVLSKPEKVAEAIVDMGLRGKAERYVPRPYALAAVARILTPRLVRRVLSGGAASSLTTGTAAESAD